MLSAGIVSYSSRIIAAMRAIEDEEPDKLFDDPLARVLAGEKAIKRVSRLLQVRCLLYTEREQRTLLTQRRNKARLSCLHRRLFQRVASAIPWMASPLSSLWRTGSAAGLDASFCCSSSCPSSRMRFRAQEADVLPGTIFEGSPLPRRVRRLTRTVIRTRWFDDGLLAALSPAAHPRPLTAQLAAAPEGGGVSLELGPSGAPIRQVVLLGAGMDSRAWRLALPPGAVM